MTALRQASTDWPVRLGAPLAVLALLVPACGGDFGGDSDDDGGSSSGDDADADAEGSEGPDLSAPPEIECEVIEEDLGEHTIKFGIGLAEDSPQGMAVQFFGDYLDECTNGQLTVQLFPDSQVGDDLEMMDGLRSGTLEMTFPSTSPAVAFVPELGVFDLPFLMPDVEAADRVLDSELGQQLLDEFDGTGMKALAWAENGFRQVTNSVRPIESPEDVEGLDLRVMENEIQTTIWEALGANPTTMAFGEVFSAMEQGVVDGQENPWVTNLTSNFWEVQEYGSQTRHVYTPFIMMIGEEFFDELDPAYQQLIQEAADATRDYQRTISREMDEWARGQFEENGPEVNVLDEDQIEEFRQATEEVYDQWAPELGEEFVDEVRTLARQE
ncbi:TRAP transporter substrate-binding protein [Actinobacteria bacterium YIM 96077]|uniref:TRAP transporter substrate-binding protein n=1 Tax=Phytoactinopolyspora halophila TaxID=1981511 RepID=A0A329QLB3_9ACTN|nr:TRAP transporter substrate-binding protein [Phytoactinopolyspora halophila]AYY12598.1 TRAP transporter substrate-binding protein [Actinobacteria bacterium YIM 96077]RAW12499.1 TRAP transporter substrate-binding protein [Phytoactinopolyspora halophila]